MSFASGDMTGSAGKWTGLETILPEDKLPKRETGECIRTACKSQSDLRSKTAGSRSETRKSEYPMPTSQQPSYGPLIE